MRYQKFTREKYLEWEKWTRVYIERINEKSYDEIRDENRYALGYRGRNHNVVLLKDGKAIARGIIAISENINYLRVYYGV